MSLTIGGVSIGAGQPCRFVAELSNNHNQSLARAHRLIDAAKAAQADFVKFQCFLHSEIVALRGDVGRTSPTPFDWFPELVNHCEAIGLPWFSSVFGMESLALLESLACPAYKIAALDHAAKFDKNNDDGVGTWAQHDLHDAVRATAKPVIQSVRGWDRRPDDWADLWLYCPPGYPQYYRSAHLHLREIARFDGFSYHGTDLTIPQRAAMPHVVQKKSWLRKRLVVRAAGIVECHVQLDGERSELETNVSLTDVQFRQMVDSVRWAEERLDDKWAWP